MLQVVKRMLEGNVLVAGGGAVEVALSTHLEKYALSVNTREQVIAKSMFVHIYIYIYLMGGRLGYGGGRFQPTQPYAALARLGSSISGSG